ncbi:MAG: cupredoxin domain-containing protein [Terriglobia bacterium]
MLSLLCALLVTLSVGTRAATVTAQVTFSPSAQHHAKVLNYSNIVLWLTPLSSELDEEADTKLSGFSHHFQLVQTHKQFEPHLLVVPVGSMVEFPNRDPFFHNVFSLYDGKRFDLGLYEAGATRSIKFDRAGVSFIFCNIHPQMSAVIIAIKTPYYGMPDKSGAVEIHSVPAGRYRMEIWSENVLPETLKSMAREVNVSEEESSLGTIVFKPARNLLAGHKNMYGVDYDTTDSSNPAYEQPR